MISEAYGVDIVGRPNADMQYLFFKQGLEQFHAITFKGYESITCPLGHLPKTNQRIISTIHAYNGWELHKNFQMVNE